MNRQDSIQFFSFLAIAVMKFFNVHMNKLWKLPFFCEGVHSMVMFWICNINPVTLVKMNYLTKVTGFMLQIQNMTGLDFIKFIRWNIYKWLLLKLFLKNIKKYIFFKTKKKSKFIQFVFITLFVFKYISPDLLQNSSFKSLLSQSCLQHIWFSMLLKG